MTIVVLSGGDSPERAVSQASGREVARALKARGHRVIALDPARPRFAFRILRAKPDCAFIALHGGRGENGVLQGFLELLGIPYTGSDTLSSALCMNKILSKKLLRAEGIPTPEFVVADGPAFSGPLPFPLPVVVKAASLGSTIGVFIVRTRRDLKAAVRKCFTYDREVFIERFIPGIEVTVGLLGNDRPEVLPAIEIRTPTGFYDYRAKYSPGGSRHVIPPALPRRTLERVSATAARAHALLRCSGLSRMEMIVARGVPYVLDINTIPGFTGTSLFPDAARAHGIPFAELCERLIALALERWKTEPKNG